MKKIILPIITLTALLLSFAIMAETYYVSPYLAYVGKDQNKVYDTLSGLTIKTDESCDIPNYSNAILTYDGRGRDSLNYKDYLHYYDEELGEVVQLEFDSSCKVLGVIGVGIRSDVVIEEVSVENYAIYELNGRFLYLENIKIYNGSQDTGEIFSRAVLKHSEENDLMFELIEATAQSNE